VSRIAALLCTITPDHAHTHKRHHSSSSNSSGEHFFSLGCLCTHFPSVSLPYRCITVTAQVHRHASYSGGSCTDPTRRSAVFAFVFFCRVFFLLRASCNRGVNGDHNSTPKKKKKTAEESCRTRRKSSTFTFSFLRCPPFTATSARCARDLGEPLRTHTHRVRR
jgi:hypothetical protein